MTFGETLKKLRTDRGLKIRDVSRLAGISISYLSAIERGDRLPPRAATIRKIEVAMGIDDNSLLRLAGEEFLNLYFSDVLTEKYSTLAGAK